MLLLVIFFFELFCRPEFHAEVEVLLDELKMSYMPTIWVQEFFKDCCHLGGKHVFQRFSIEVFENPYLDHWSCLKKATFTCWDYNQKHKRKDVVSCIEKSGVEKLSNRRCHWKSRVPGMMSFLDCILAESSRKFPWILKIIASSLGGGNSNIFYFSSLPGIKVLG